MAAGAQTVPTLRVPFGLRTFGDGFDYDFHASCVSAGQVAESVSARVAAGQQSSFEVATLQAQPGSAATTCDFEGAVTPTPNNLDDCRNSTAAGRGPTVALDIGIGDRV